MHPLPETGFLRLPQIIGQAGVTKEQAAANKETQKGPRKPRPAISPIIPVGPTTWWNGVKSGRFPRPYKITPGATAWKVEDIRKLIESSAMEAALPAERMEA